MEPFRVGVNYWPARTAMGWWAQFDQAVVAADFARIAGSGLDSVRVFLTWEDFQPAPNQVDRVMLERLVGVADLAAESGLSLVPTLFTGHMSGVNWLPTWALGGSEAELRNRPWPPSSIRRGRAVRRRGRQLVRPRPGRVPPKPARTTRPPLSSLSRRSRDERATFGVTPPELLAHVT